MKQFVRKEDIEEVNVTRNELIKNDTLIHSLLYVPYDPTLCDNEEQVCVMDYKGIDEWIHTDTFFDDMTVEEYIPWHIGRTMDCVKIVTKGE